jgi:hypothetical protein
MNYISFHTLINKHVFVLEIDIQIPRHFFIIWCMRRRFSAVLFDLQWKMIAFRARAHVEEMFIPDKKYSTRDVGYLSYASRA